MKTPVIPSILLLIVLSGCSLFIKTLPKDDLRKQMGVNVTPISIALNTTPEVSYQADVLMARAEGYFLDRQYPEAAEEYGRFLELHATHKWASYALFRQGQAYMIQIRGADREPTLARKAKNAFDVLIENYPDSPAVPLAKQYSRQANNQLAMHELGIARFYLNTHRPEASIARLDYLLATFPDSQAALDAVLVRAQVLSQQGETAQAIEAYRDFLDRSGPATDPGLIKRAKKALSKLEQG